MKRLDGRIFPTSTDSSASEPTQLIPLLYVEDNETNFDIAQNILMSHFEVTWARSPNEARTHLSKSRPAVILLDIEFSGEEESGLDFLAALRNGEITSHYKVLELPVVILTAYSSAYDPHELKGYGADDAIFKPIEPTQLTSICHALAQRTIQLEDNSQSYDQLQREMKELKDKLVSSQIAYETTNKVLARATERLAEQYQSRTKLIEERNLLQREIDEATKQLIRADRLATLGSLVSGVAHDITNPTNLIAMNKEVLHTHIRELESVIAELLGDASGEEADILHKMFQKVFNNSKEALNDITLGIDRIYAINQAIRKQSRNDDEKTEFVVHELLKECVTIVRARSKTVELILTGNESIEFTGYRSHLGQVFMNLLSNGIDAAEEKSNREGSTARVEVSFELSSTDLELSVKDNGDGVPLKLRDKIFEPFFTTKPSGQGTGLGMPIILKIIQEHDGKIELDSSHASQGAHFRVSLPLINDSME